MICTKQAVSGLVINLPVQCLNMVKLGNAMANRVFWLNGLLVQATIVAKMVVCILEWRFD